VNTKNLVKMNDVNGSNWGFVGDRVVTNIKGVRCAKTGFSSFRSLGAAAFQSCKHLSIWSEFQISFRSDFRIIFNHLNVIS
jgi:hypothetical protein